MTKRAFSWPTGVRAAIVWAAFGLAVAACGAPVASTSEAAITDPTAQVARAGAGIVSSAEPIATEVGARVLAEGGNAVDAAVATAFTLAVVEPTMSGIGGRTSILIRTADGEVYGIDGITQVPWSYEEDVAPPGYDRAAIPGVPAALGRMLDEFGTWPLDRVLQPAIRLAEQGYPLPELEARRFRDAAEELRSHPASRRYFLKPDGSAYDAGDRFVQRDLARTLRGLADEGGEAFYRGWIADSIHADMSARGGFITRDELAQYEAQSAILVRGEYRGHQLVSNFRPASGHAVIQALQMMERFEVPGSGESAEWASLIGQATQVAIADRRREFGTERESARMFVSQRYAEERSAGIGGPHLTAEERSDELRGEPALQAASGVEEHTTHLSVADRDGMVVALTQSLGPSMGTRLAASGLGFLYATRLGAAPGSRPSSTISPTIITAPAGVTYVLGAAGDARIISAVIQAVSRLVDHGYALDDAVAAPRIHPMSSRELAVEVGDHARWSVAELERLQSFGFDVDSAESSVFGRIHAVSLDLANGVFTGIAEPRGGGGVAGVNR
jgi:gamma-glutamyltranspeptidase / glutathione hydrolase